MHESYLQFARAGRLQLEDRVHFLRWTGRVMRSVIVDFARRRQADRRGGAVAHAQLVVHRDLKPSNLLVIADGQVRLLDFGIAKLLEQGQTRQTALTELAGRPHTPEYASPEQITGEPLSTASDIYSLGVVLYELLTGTRPYQLRQDSLPAPAKRKRYEAAVGQTMLRRPDGGSSVRPKSLPAPT